MRSEGLKREADTGVGRCLPVPSGGGEERASDELGEVGEAGEAEPCGILLSLLFFVFVLFVPDSKLHVILKCWSWTRILVISLWGRRKYT